MLSQLVLASCAALASKAHAFVNATALCNFLCLQDLHLHIVAASAGIKLAASNMLWADSDVVWGT